MLLLSLVTQNGRMQQTKKALINMKSLAHCSAVNRFVEVPSSTGDTVGTVIKNLLEIQQNNFSALIKTLSSIFYLVHQFFCNSIAGRRRS